MAIEDYAEDEFGKRLGEILSASRPIHSIEYLKGRDKELDTIKKSLYAPGRQIFIYGDRGVGKSSLGQTAAYLYQDSGAAPIFVSGSPDDSFNTVIANIINQAIRQPRTEIIKKTKSTSVEIGGIRFGEGIETSGVDFAGSIHSIGDAVAFLEQIAEIRSGNTAIVIDEFDAIGNESERNKFAALLKQMGDRSINLKLIFTGIGKSLDDLLGTHQSSYRQIEAVELPRLGWEARREIAQSAANTFDLELDDNVNWRIAMVSDGFPYYIHLITEKILWAAFSAEEVVTRIGSELFSLGLCDAVSSTSAELKRPYEKAVVHHPEMEDLVWATADHDDLVRSLEDIFQSYEVIHSKRADGGHALQRSKFSSQIRKLKNASYGSILIQANDRPGFYTYREKMLRGYVRMQAESSGIELTGERPAPKQVMHVGNVRSGYCGPKIPVGVRISKQISEWEK